MFAQFSAAAFAYYSFVCFVKNNAEWNVDLVAYRTAFDLMREDLGSHNRKLAGLFLCMEVTKVGMRRAFGRVWSAFYYNQYFSLPTSELGFARGFSRRGRPRHTQTRD
jgi:hypothetical protein